MRMTWLALTLTALLLLASCSGFPFLGRAEPAHEGMDAPGDTDGGAESPARAHVELQNIRYDGRMLTGRLLVGALEHGLTLDKRIIESIYLTTESVRDCATEQPVGFVVMDVYARPPREEDILILKPGYWYGKDASILLFAGEPDGHPTPTCIDAEFAFRALGGKTAAVLRVRAMRDPQPAPEAGISPDAGMAVDAGSAGQAM